MDEHNALATLACAELDFLALRERIGSSSERIAPIDSDASSHTTH
jgi:hypothetical protein